MENFYLICAVVGGTLLVGQFLLGLLGLGHDGDSADHDASFDADHDADGHGSAWFAGVLSFRAIVAAVTLFGLSGLAANAAGRDSTTSFAVAFGGGLAGLLLVASLMRALAGLAEDGTVHIGRSVGKPATVYLTVPAGRSSAGKVTLRLQNRTVEYQALTAHHEPLPTGARVTVVAVVSPDTVEVAPDAHTPEASHAV